jgi:hypothetical protein
MKVMRWLRGVADKPAAPDDAVRPEGYTGRRSTLTAGEVREIRRVYAQWCAARDEGGALKARHGDSKVRNAIKPECHKWVR